MKTSALCLFLLWTSSCATTPAARPTPNSAFAGFVDVVYESRYQFRPSQGTASGFHQFDSKLEDFSAARLEARRKELRAQLDQLHSFAPATLSFDDQIDAAVLDGELRAELLDLETLRVFHTNPMIYAGLAGSAIDGLMKRQFAPAPERMKSVIARLRQVPNLYAAAQANLERPAREFTDLALRMAKGTVGFLETAVPLWAKGAGADAALNAELTEASAQAIAAARAFSTWLEKDLLPRSDGRYAIGEEQFLAKLRYEEHVDLKLPELLARGEAQLARDHAAFLETARKIDPTKGPMEVMRSISSDHPTAEDLIPSTARSIEEARQFLIEKQIVTLPSDNRPVVGETPPYARSGTFASMDSPGAYESKATEAFYYVTPVEKDWDAKYAEEHLRAYNKYAMAAINVHEAYPGHFVQFLFSPRFPTKVRRLSAASSNSEGWAHYAEQMMLDEGFGGGDPRYRLAQLQEALLRDCRYVVGIKLHTAGMTVEEGARMFMEKCFQERPSAFEEARRGAYNPTYLYYALGKIEIFKLRDEYRAATGKSLREFHDAFLREGALPIPLLRKILLTDKPRGAPALTAR